MSAVRVGPPSGDAFVVTGARARVRPDAVVSEELYVVGELLTASPGEPGAEVVAADGAYAVPLLVDSALAQLPSARRDRFDLVPGNPADLATASGGTASR